jgi:hypothetical protein
MPRTIRLMLTDEHWATLTLAGKLTGQSRSALMREGIERITGEILSAPRTKPRSTKTNAAGTNRGAQKSEAPDHDST